jgi:PAS domain S-box-containing protein
MSSDHSCIAGNGEMAELWSLLTEQSFMPMVAGEGAGHMICHVNPAFCKLVGKSRAELIGKPLASIMPKGDRCLLALDRVSRTGVSESFSQKEGSEPHPLYWSYAMWPIRATPGEAQGVVVQVTESAVFHHQLSTMNEALILGALRQDELKESSDRLALELQAELRDRKEAESALQQSEADLRTLSESLEQRVRERTADLMASNEQLQGFSYLVAHDLRQQIRGISVNAHLVLEEAGEILEGSSRDHLLGLIGASKTLAMLVDDMLAYAHIGSRQPRRLRVDFSHAARRYAEKMALVYPEAVFEIQEGLEAFGDPAMLYLVIENLVDNASKYSSHTEHPKIEVGKIGEEFFVRDNGIGFDMAYADKVFLPFERLHARVFPGTGIGLANVKRVVDKHGGNVRAESKVNIGSTFYFSLP